MKANKTITKFALGIMILGGTWSCTANYDEINRNPNEVTDEEKDRDNYAIVSAMNGLQNWVIPAPVNTCQFTECLLGGPLSGYFSDSQSGWNPNKISTYNANNNWTRVMFQDIIPELYPNLKEVNEGTTQETPLAIADVIKVASMHRITDTYGPMPYTKIGVGGELQVAYDSQEVIYDRFFEELNAAIDILTAHKDEFISAEADLIYGGSVEKWLRFANSLKLRLAMRIVYANPDKAENMAEQVAAHSVGTMTSNADNASLKVFGIDGNPINASANYNSVGSTTGGDHHVSADITSYMNGYADPRCAAYFIPFTVTPTPVYAGLRSGITIPSSSIAFQYSGIKIGNKDPLQWMNVAEVMFLKAEGAARGWDMGGSAQSFYETGIALSFEQWGAQGAAAYTANSTAVPASYTDPLGTYTYGTPMSTITIAWNESALLEEKLERIIVQKWLANWTLGNESWAERRRTGYPVLLPVVVNGSNGKLADNAIPRRLPYPLEEYQTNTANVNAAVATLLGGNDDMATRVWWDKK